MKIALCLCSYDGINSMYCGVGTITSTFIDSFFSQYTKIEQDFGVNIDFYLFTSVVNDKYIGYNTELENLNKKRLQQLNGKMIVLSNESEKNDQYGNIQNRDIISRKTAQTIFEYTNHYDFTIVINTDTPFLSVPKYLNQIQTQKYFHYLWLHSDAYIHEKENLNRKRVVWEKNSLKYAIQTKNVFLLDVNSFFTNHLQKNYQIPSTKFLPLKNGLFFGSKKYKLYDKETLKGKLLDYKIPLDKKIIFALGRAVPYKGLDTVINLFMRIQRTDLHLVLIAAPYEKDGGEVLKLKKLLEKINSSSYSFISTADFVLPSYLYQRENTKLILQLSKAEPFGLVPEEVRLCAKESGGLILASSIEGFIEQIDDGVDGFLVTPYNLLDIEKKVNEILSLNDEKFFNIRQRGYLRVIENYNYEKNLYNFFKVILSNIK